VPSAKSDWLLRLQKGFDDAGNCQMLNTTIHAYKLELSMLLQDTYFFLSYAVVLPLFSNYIIIPGRFSVRFDTSPTWQLALDKPSIQTDSVIGGNWNIRNNIGFEEAHHVAIAHSQVFWQSEVHPAQPAFP
jgi:hypothetical protein